MAPRLLHVGVLVVPVMLHLIEHVEQLLRSGLGHADSVRFQIADVWVVRDPGDLRLS